MVSGPHPACDERAPLGRCGLVWLTSTLLVLLLLGWLRPDLPTGMPSGAGYAGPPAPSFDLLLVRLSAVAATLAATWLWVLTTLVAGMAALGRSTSRVPGLPRAWRRLVLTACGVALVGAGSTAVAAAAAVPTPSADRAVGHADHGDTPSLAGLPYPDRTAPDTRSGGRAGCAAPRQVVVRTGDTLWDLARGQLGPDADDRDRTRAWHRLYALNRAVIGADPDLIHPHLRLRVPCR